jgi:hypothetical protein
MIGNPLFSLAHGRSECSAHRARNHQFFVRANDANRAPVPARGNHPLVLRVIIHSSIQTCPPAWHRRAWTETFAGSARCKSKTSFHRVRRGERWLRPRSFRKWGLWSRILILSWSCFFLGCCCHCVLIPIFTRLRVNRKFLFPLLNRLVIFWLPV